MTKFSFLMPSLFPELGAAACARIREIMAAYDFEIILAGPYDASGPHTKWLREDQPRGNCPANAACYGASTGDVVIYLSDDVALQPDFATITLPHFMARAAEIPHLLGGFYALPVRVGTVFGRYYPWFGIARRATIEAAGGFFDARFSAHFGDSDLGLRVWRLNGGRCELLPGHAIEPVEREPSAGGPIVSESANKMSKKAQDLAHFRALWAHDLGRGWLINCLRDFSHDIEPDLLAVFCRDNTVLWPDPMFGEIVKTYYRNVGFETYFTYWDGGHALAGIQPAV